MRFLGLIIVESSSPALPVGDLVDKLVPADRKVDLIPAQWTSPLLPEMTSVTLPMPYFMSLGVFYAFSQQLLLFSVVVLGSSAVLFSLLLFTPEHDHYSVEGRHNAIVLNTSRWLRHYGI